MPNVRIMKSALVVQPAKAVKLFETDLIGGILNDLDYDLTTTTNLDDARRELRTRSYDAVISGVMYPRVLGGWTSEDAWKELYMEVQSLRHEPYFILLTPLSERSIDRGMFRGYTNPRVHYILQSGDLNELREKFRQALKPTTNST